MHVNLIDFNLLIFNMIYYMIFYLFQFLLIFKWVFTI